MKQVFIVPGYGIPPNTLKDNAYRAYLTSVTKQVTNYLKTRPLTKCVLIFCGGKTALDKPFNRTEAGEMVRLFTHVSRNTLSSSQIKINKEQKSISSLENLVNANNALQRLTKTKKQVIIFFERTRAYRGRELAKIVIKGKKIKVIPVDLYTPEQMKHIKLMQKKDKLSLNASLWALRSTEHYKKLHRIYLRRIRILRRTPPGNREVVNRNLWTEALQMMKGASLEENARKFLKSQLPH